LCVILRHAQQLSPYYACFPKVARAFIKVMAIVVSFYIILLFLF